MKHGKSEKFKMVGNQIHHSELTKGYIIWNKTKYFRLRLTDEGSSERPKRDLRET